MPRHRRPALTPRFALGLLVTGSLTGRLAYTQQAVPASAQKANLASVKMAAVPAQPTASAPLVLRGATVVDVRSGQRVPDQQVVIVGNRVQSVTKASRTPFRKDARVIDARGKYIIPGLWDLHVHLSSTPRHHAYWPLLANGMTGFREAGAAVPPFGGSVATLDTLRRWRKEVLAGTLVGPPREILSGVIINQSMSDEAAVRRLVDSIRSAGADMIKAREINKSTYVMVAREARRLGVPLGGHAHGDTATEGQVTPVEASALGAHMIDHELGGARCWDPGGQPSQVDVEACRASIRQFRQNDTWFVTTAVWTAGNDSSKLRVVGAFGSAVDQFSAGSPLQGLSMRNVLAPIVQPVFPMAFGGNSDAHLKDSLQVLDLVRHKLPILAGSDCYSTLCGFWLHLELANLVRYGWTPLDALRAATLNPAEALHATDSLGTVEAGKLADLVVLDADPLADISNTAMIRAVIADGRYYNRAALDDLLAKARYPIGDPNP